MRRCLIACTLVFAGGSWFVHAQQAPPKEPAATPAAVRQPAAKAVPFTATVDNIMRGPKLIGSAPSAVRFSPDSSKIYFSWQKPDEERPTTWVVNRDGSGLKQLTPEEMGQIQTAPTGRPDRAHKRLLGTAGGDIVVYDAATGARRPLMRTAANESNPRWARKDTAVTFMRDGNLYLMTLDAAATTPTEVQLTEVAGEPAAGGARGAMGAGAAAGQRGAGGPAQAQGGQGGLTDSQRLLRDEEQRLFEYLEAA